MPVPVLQRIDILIIIIMGPGITTIITTERITGIILIIITAALFIMAHTQDRILLYSTNGEA